MLKHYPSVKFEFLMVINWWPWRIHLTLSRVIWRKMTKISGESTCCLIFSDVGDHCCQHTCIPTNFSLAVYSCLKRKVCIFLPKPMINVSTDPKANVSFTRDVYLSRIRNLIWVPWMWLTLQYFFFFFFAEQDEWRKWTCLYYHNISVFNM